MLKAKNVQIRNYTALLCYPSQIRVNMIVVLRVTAAQSSQSHSQSQTSFTFSASLSSLTLTRSWNHSASHYQQVPPDIFLTYRGESNFTWSNSKVTIPNSSCVLITSDTDIQPEYHSSYISSLQILSFPNKFTFIKTDGKVPVIRLSWVQT